MKFSELAESTGIKPIKDFNITSLTSDSRKAVEGTLFFLLPRASSDFAHKAFESGAEVIHDRDLAFGIKVFDVQKAYSESLKRFYQESFKNLRIYGVTGTNGKTSFSYMLRAMLESYDEPTGLFGTIGNFFREKSLKTELTSPTAEDFYQFNHENYKAGMKCVVCEVSSHALDQKRLGTRFLSGAAFTSFSQDHFGQQ